MTAPAVNRDRLWDSLMTMARIGATERGGVSRLTGTDLDRESRDLFRTWCEEAGCTVAVDDLGNMFARRAGSDPDRAPIGIGSHLDSQPTGGKFDGALGVLAALEVVRSLNDHGISTPAPIEIINWTNEEGARFSPPMTASGVYGGVFTREFANSRMDENGVTLGEELARIGYVGDVPVGSNRLERFLELHLEQGPVLEEAGELVGIVTRGQAQRWYEVTIRGQEAHAGPTPMKRRRDALLTASRIVDRVHTLGLETDEQACATVGQMHVRPNSRNVIPGEVFFSIDFRHPDPATLDAMDQQLRTDIERITAKAGTEADVSEFWYCPPTVFDTTCVQALRNAAEAAGLPGRDMISGAGHDALYVARVVPTAMVFVPCRDGISHNEAEYVSPEACAAGAQVLLGAAIELAK